MKALEDYFSPAVGTLFHYTGVGSLLKIVESKRIFASHAYYLNDAKEITHASSMLLSALVGYEGCCDHEEREFLKQFAEWLKSLRSPYGVFIFSLSEQMSLLSQWRSYTPHGKGVSLGFSPKFLNELVRQNGFRLAKCIYGDEEQKELASALVEKMFTSFREHRNSLDLSQLHPSQRYHGLLEEFRGDLLQVLAIMKHSTFSEECEWRIVSSYYPSFKGPHLKFREGASMLMPYIEMPFPESSEENNIFDKVILGPSQDQNLSFAALSNYLSNQQICVHTLNSGIPYRKW